MAAPQQQPFSFFFFEAFKAFFEPDFSDFFSFLSFLPEALALPGAAKAACGDPGITGPGAGWPLSCAISSGVREPPAANLAKISGETFMRAGAAATIGAP